MSAENYVLVRKEGTQWVGYMQSMSLKEAQYDNLLFRTEALEDAIVLAQEQNTEYGYQFEVEGLYAGSS